MSDVRERLTVIVREQLGYDGELKDETEFERDLGIDSLDAVELVMACEEEFSIEIADRDVDELKTFGQAVEWLEGRVG